ncbi:MAG: class I SAM-dependent methyltransferase [Bacteroidota bacterium]
MSNFIKDFWESQAVKHQTHHSASWGDNFAIDLEVATIGKHINEGDVVLDMGCANGFASFRQLADRKPAKIYGVDYAANMVKYANQVRDEYPEKDKLEFTEGDIREIAFEDNKFDVVYTTRVIINLPNWEDQKKAIDECMRVTKKGGTVVFSEAFYEPLQLLNAMRALKQLPPLVEHDFNRYIKKDRMEKYLAEKGYSFECDEFSSIYYLGSRFLRELVTNPADYAGYSNPINEVFYGIEKDFSGGGFGIQQAYIVKKS